MSKVIVERPRKNSHWRGPPRRVGRLDPSHIVLDEDHDDARFGFKISHQRAVRQARQYKYLNENLAPLRRFLLQQVGRPWNAVYSEISQHLRPSNPVQQHVREHVEDFVAIKTNLRDGDIWIASRRYAPRLLKDSAGWLLLYVDPNTGILHRNPYRSTHSSRTDDKVWEAALRAAWVREDPERPAYRDVLLDDGNWWEVRLTRGGDFYEGRLWVARVTDVVERAGLSTRPRTERYGIGDRVAAEKRPLPKRELEALGLRAPPPSSR